MFLIYQKLKIRFRWVIVLKENFMKSNIWKHWRVNRISYFKELLKTCVIVLTEFENYFLFLQNELYLMYIKLENIIFRNVEMYILNVMFMLKNWVKSILNKSYIQFLKFQKSIHRDVYFGVDACLLTIKVPWMEFVSCFRTVSLSKHYSPIYLISLSSMFPSLLNVIFLLFFHCISNTMLPEKWSNFFFLENNFQFFFVFSNFIDFIHPSWIHYQKIRFFKNYLFYISGRFRGYIYI